MSIQKVNTEAIAAAASAITTANNRINCEFERVRAAGNSMDNSWNSKAGNTARDMMYQLFSGNETRSSVLQNYANTLQQVVTPGYDLGEKENTKLADLFL